MKNLLAAAFLLLLLTSIAVAQPRIDTLKHGKETSGAQLLRLHPKTGEVFHYRIVTKSLVTAKNSDELLEIPNLRPDDKSTYSISYFITASVRKTRNDGAVDFQIYIDSIHSGVNDNGKIQSYTSTLTGQAHDPMFEDKAIFAGRDLGVIVDTLGSLKEVYGFYAIAEQFENRLPDSLQTGDRFDSIADDVSSHIKNIVRHIFCYLSKDQVAPGDTLSSSVKEDYPVWSSLAFPVEKTFREILSSVEERDGKLYAVYSGETVITPMERVLEEPEYHTTLPNYSFLNSDRYYVDCSNGMLAFDKWTEDQSYGMKIESKLPAKAGKNFVTVQHSKVETVIELLR